MKQVLSSGDEIVNSALDVHGSDVYALKESSKKTDPPHWICPQCYEDGRKSMLIDSDPAKGFPRIKCPRCKFETTKRTLEGRKYV